MFRDPTGNALTHAQLQAIEQLMVRILGRPQYQIVSSKHVNETRVAFYETNRKIEHAVKSLVKSVGRGDADYGVVQNIYLRIFNRGSGHNPTLSRVGGRVQSHLFMAEISLFCDENSKPGSGLWHRSRNSCQLTLVIAPGYQYVQGFAFFDPWRRFVMVL
jgi:hypothetical protein